MANLHVKSGPLAGQVIAVDRELVIGREHADITIDDPKISRRHLALRPLADGFEVEDLGSTNGTFVDERRIDGSTRVGSGARIRLGSTEFELADVPVAAATVLHTQLRQAPTGIESDRVPADPPPVGDVASAPAPSPVRAAAIEEPPIAPAPSRARSDRRGGAVPAPGPFSPPTRRRRRGLASRSWIPVVLSFGSVVLTAAGLVIYFAAR